MIAVAHPALVGERHDQPLTISGCGRKDPVKGSPVKLISLDVGGYSVLESPDTHQGVRGQRGEKFV